MPAKANRMRMASILAMAVLAVTAFPRTADAFFCFSFSIGGGPRYSYWAPSSPFGPWYGPTVDYPGGGFGGFPGSYASPLSGLGSGWGNPWGGRGGARNPYAVYGPYAAHGHGMPAYAPMGWGSPWQTSQWQTSPWQPSPWPAGHPLGSPLSPPGIWPMGGLAYANGLW